MLGWGLKLVEQLILSFLTSVGFGMIQLVPKKELVYSGLSGMGGWFIYWIALECQINVTLATFLGSLTIAGLSYWFAVMRKKPSTMYNIPGIVALVPGAVSYQMTYSLIIGRYNQATYYSIRMLSLAGAIAGGLIIWDLGLRLVKERKQK